MHKSYTLDFAIGIIAWRSRDRNNILEQMAIKKSSQGFRKWKSNKAESGEQGNKCPMAKVRSQSVCTDSLYKDLLLDHEKLLKLNTVVLAMSKNYKQENSKLKEENNRLVKQAKCFENTLEELVSQKDFL